MIVIEKKEKCNGCHACSNICPVQCIEMKEDSEGFRYPKIDTNICIKCNACIDVCPLLKGKKDIFKEPKAYACLNKDEKIRMESSSGGIFTLLAEKILNDNGVVFGAAFTKELGLEHKYIEKKEDLDELRGSKYLQSEVGNSFKQVLEFLKGGRKVLFSGTPCQIGGLKSYINKKTNNKEFKNLLCVDFICHGVPSPKVWKKYKKNIEEKNRVRLIDVKFRNKDSGWKLFNLKLEFSNEKKQIKNLREDKYMRAFLTDICLRPACHECGFKSKGRVSDITMADFWGIQNVEPELDDDKGTSLILVHSKRGKDYYKSISESIISKEVDIDEALKYNSSAVKSVKPHKNRENYFRDLEELTFEELHNKYVKDSLIKIVLKKIKRCLKG